MSIPTVNWEDWEADMFDRLDSWTDVDEDADLDDLYDQYPDWGWQGAGADDGS